MITRLQIDGFKNLVDVDIPFGKFNVITGANGIGKSNLCDAIQFVSNLAQIRLLDAVKKIRGADRGHKSIFFQHKLALNHPIKINISLKTKTIDNLNYEIELVNHPKNFLFINQEKLYREDFISFRTEGDYIWTALDDKAAATHASGNSFLYAMYSRQEIRYFDESKEEILSWQILNFSPDEIRHDDRLIDDSVLSPQGRHLPAVLNRMKQSVGNADQLMIQLSNRLFELTGEIKAIDVKTHEPTESIWIEVKDPDGTWHNARALSDGTLRFLALAVLWLDPEAKGVFCIEEPENGIHPSKIPALMRLLRDISEKPDCQVIVNTHSPALVAQTPAEDIIVAYPVQRAEPDGTCYTIPRFAGLKGTWRQDAGMHVATISQVMDYLDPIPQRYADEPLRLLDREDARRLLERRRERTWEVTED